MVELGELFGTNAPVELKNMLHGYALFRREFRHSDSNAIISR